MALTKTSLAVVGKWPCSAAQSPLGSVGTSHHIGTVLLPLLAAPGTHHGWVSAKHHERHHCQRFLRLPASHTSSNIGRGPAGCHSWHLMYSFRCSRFNSKESMRDQRKCCIYPMQRDTSRTGEGGTTGLRNSHRLFSWCHTLKRTKARLLVSKWILSPALRHFKYLSC